MFGFEQDTGGVGLRAGPAAAALAALAIPLLSGAFLVAALFVVFGYQIVPLVIILGFAVNLSNLLLILLALRYRAISIRLRSLMVMAAILSGVYLSTLMVLLGWFSMLGL